MKSIFNTIIYNIEEQEKDEAVKLSLMTLAVEGFINFDQYPDDKMARWLGYLLGVMKERHYTNINLNNVFLFLDQIRTEPLKGERLALIKIRNYYLKNEKNKRLRSFLVSSRKITILGQHFQLGVYQGIKIERKEMNIEQERNFTRPYFHSYHKEKIPTFSTQ